MPTLQRTTRRPRDPEAITPTWRKGKPMAMTVREAFDKGTDTFNLIFDRLAMLEQLGLIPAPAPTG